MTDTTTETTVTQLHTPVHVPQRSTTAENVRTRIVVLDARMAAAPEAQREYDGRERSRNLLLRFMPVVPSDEEIELSAHDARMPRSGGVQWKLVRRDDIAIAVRARTFSTPARAMRDARELVASADQLGGVLVHDPDTGKYSWWIHQTGEVVLVANRVWSARGSMDATRDLRSVLRELRQHREAESASRADRSEVGAWT